MAAESFSAEEPSAYEFVKGEIIKASPMTESEVNRFLDKLANVPMSYLKEARSEAIKLQDEMAVGILTMAINRRSFREEWASEEDEDDGYWDGGEAPWRESASKYDEYDESNPFSLPNLLWLNKHGGVPKLNDGEHHVLKTLKSLLYNWDGEPEYSDVFQEELQKACGDYPSSLKRTLNSLSKKGLIDVQNVPTGEYKQTKWQFTRDKDGNLIPITKPLIYPKPLMVLYAINMGWGNPEWLQYALDDSKKQAIFHTETQCDYCEKNNAKSEFPPVKGYWGRIHPDDPNENDKMGYCSQECFVGSLGKCDDCSSPFKIGDNYNRQEDEYEITLTCDDCFKGYPICESCGDKYHPESEHMESCNRCGGNGWIMTDYDPGDRWEPPSSDSRPCEECYDGKVCSLEAESFSAESEELEESKKRTKMSAIRTGLAITTFGIVLWNLWTNKKQESQISDIMDLV